jgi:small subunit ribosomal protein S17
MAECNDPKCAVHGTISVRGNVFRGKVISAKADKTVSIERELIKYIPKYERYRKIRSKIAAHNPPCINAKEGDIVTVGETRKLSKTKSFVVLSKIGQKKAVEEQK